MSFCSNCGEKIQPGQKFCASCGKKVRIPSSDTGDIKKSPYDVLFEKMEINYETAGQGGRKSMGGLTKQAKEIISKIAGKKIQYINCFYPDNIRVIYSVIYSVIYRN